MADRGGPEPVAQPVEESDEESLGRVVEQTEPTFRSGLAQALQEQFSFEKAFGGVRGVLESVVPVTVFSVVFGITRDVKTSTVAAVVPAVLLAGWRLVAREPLTQAVGGLLGVGIGAVLALRTGEAQTFFLPSIIKNAVWAAAYLISILVRWPAIGIFLGLMLGEGTHWRRDPARLRAYRIATWFWFGMFALRLAIQLPLYLADRPATLGAVNVGLGLPLFGLVLWGTWLVVRRVPPARPDGVKGPLHLPQLYRHEPDAGVDAPRPSPERPSTDRPVPEV